jgi:hypothetical protein
MLYIVKRTQLYLNEDLWQALHAEALLQGSTISELVRQAVRERFSKISRATAMEAVVGMRSDNTFDVDTHIRDLRRGASRQSRLTHAADCD